MRDAARSIVDTHGRIDLAVYCAGYYKPMRATAFDLDDALRHEQVNYVGALHLLDAVLPHAAAQRRPATSAWSAACRATAACPRRWPTGRPRPR
jgi:NAD(P)-dependent dehydrogenase (short-subunit alcohol dehydrogenase family)